MKRMLLILSAALLLGALSVSFISQNNNYVLIVMGETSIETSVWFALLLLMISAYLGLLFVRLVFGLRLFSHKKQISQQVKSTQQGVLAYSKGQWQEAIDNLTQAQPEAGASFANLLMAAQAANELGNWGKAQQFLEQAEEREPKAKLAVDLIRATLLASNQNWKVVIPLLEKLNKKLPAHRKIISLLHTAYIQTQAWEDLKSLEKSLRKKQSKDKSYPLSEKQLTQWEQQTWGAIQAEATKKN